MVTPMRMASSAFRRLQSCSSAFCRAACSRSRCSVRIAPSDSSAQACFGTLVRGASGPFNRTSFIVSYLMVGATEFRSPLSLPSLEPRPPELRRRGDDPLGQPHADGHEPPRPPPPPRGGDPPLGQPPADGPDPPGPAAHREVRVAEVTHPIACRQVESGG